MINALNARGLTTKAIELKVSQKEKEIEAFMEVLSKSIEEQANNCKLSCQFECTEHSKDIIKRLKDLGYAITQLNYSNYVIHW